MLRSKSVSVVAIMMGAFGAAMLFGGAPAKALDLDDLPDLPIRQIMPLPLPKPVIVIILEDD